MTSPTNTLTDPGSGSPAPPSEARGKRAFPPDLERLLRPISEDAPAGEFLRYTAVYDAIQEARRADDPSLPQGVWQRDLKKADWEAVAGLCQEALAEKSKDLYLVIWLIEAWLHRHGVAGLAVGLEVLYGISRDFWETAYPAIDPEDPDVRAAPFEWLNDRIPVALGTIAISKPDSTDVFPYTWAELQEARFGSTAGRREPPARPGAADDRPNLARIQTSVSLTPTPWLSGLASQVDAALDATGRTMSVLQLNMPDAPPSLRRIEEALQEMKRWLATTLEERPGAASPPPPAAAPETEVAPPLEEELEPMPLAEGGVVRSREEAYHLLAVAAEYLMRTEPHSPTPYLVQRAVNWGKMPLADLLDEYAHDGNDLRALRILLGLGDGA